MRIWIAPLALLALLCGNGCERASNPAKVSQEEGEENWAQFRGPGSGGVAKGDALPERWSATENVAWKASIPGRGWSSPIVWGNRVFLTTAVSSAEAATPRKGLYIGDERNFRFDSAHQWKVYCLDLQTGNVLWDRKVYEGIPLCPIHAKNSRASETPVTDGERVYAYFGNLGIWCLDFEGKIVWPKSLVPHNTRRDYGTAASPTLYKDQLYITNDNEEDSYLIALDKLTGNETWRVSREEKTNWSTPFIWENEARIEIVTAGSDKVRSYDLAGTLLWWLQGMSTDTIATPYSYKGLLYVSSGNVTCEQRPIYAIRPGATGDISLASGQSANEWIVWSKPQAAPYNPTTLAYNDRLYVLHDMGSITCFNALTGAEIYQPAKIPRGLRFASSPWAYGGKIFCLNEDGETFVIKAGDQFELLHTNPLADNEMAMASPAIVKDRLLIRTSSGLYCIRNSS